jgi:hypothetical protein
MIPWFPKCGERLGNAPLPLIKGEIYFGASNSDFVGLIVQSEI